MEDVGGWREFVAELKSKDVLRWIDRDRLPKHEEGWVLVPCADGHRFRNLFEYHLRTCGRGPCHHPLTTLGGILPLGTNSPLAVTRRGFRADEVLIDNIEASLELKELRNVAAYTHFPCGAAHKAKLTAEEQFELFATAVENLRARLSKDHVLNGSRVLGFCHLDLGGDLFETYFADVRLYRRLQSVSNVD